MDNCGSQLPLDIITDILLRLSVTPLLRFRCVSKQWCNLLDSPYFIRKHLTNDSNKTNNNLRLIISNTAETRFYSVDICNFLEKKLNRKGKNVLVGMNPPLMKNRRFQVWGSCKGLLLCWNDRCLIIWNPATQKHRNLPPTPVPSKRSPLHLCKSIYGFGYVSQAKDYVIVGIQNYYVDKDIFSHSDVDVYSHGSNSWRRIEGGLLHKLCLPSSLPGVLVNERLHWVNIYDQVFAFEIEYESFRMVPLPDIDTKDVDVSISPFDGCLCVFYKVRKVCFEVWVMTEYGLKESWTKLLTVNYSDHGFWGASKSFCVVPTAYARDANKVIFQKTLAGRRWFLSYDLLRKTVDEVDIDGTTDLFVSMSYLETFVDPTVECLSDGE